MEARKVVAEALDRGLPLWQDLPPDLRPALESHCDSLVALVASLHAAGRGPEMIRELVATLLQSYGADLVAALEARG